MPYPLFDKKFALPQPLGRGRAMRFTEEGELVDQPSIKEIVGRNALRRKGQVKSDIDDLVMLLDMSYGCISKIHDVLKQCGVDTTNLPPMFYEEGLLEAIQKQARQIASKELASIGAFPGFPATHKYIAVEENGKVGYVKVPLKEEKTLTEEKKDGNQGT